MNKIVKLVQSNHFGIVIILYQEETGDSHPLCIKLFIKHNVCVYIIYLFHHKVCQSKIIYSTRQIKDKFQLLIHFSFIIYKSHITSEINKTFIKIYQFNIFSLMSWCVPLTTGLNVSVLMSRVKISTEHLRK